MPSNRGNNDKSGERARKLWRLIEDIKIGMLVTRDENRLRSRPMECVQVEESGILWFFTKASSPKTGEVQEEHEVCLALADKVNQDYVSISGTAEIVHDPAKAKELWSEEQRTWFPGGLDDPELALLKLHVKQAEYWDRPASAMVAAQGLVRAVAGEVPELSENEKLTFERSH